MPPKSNTERIQADFNEDAHREKERERIRKIREKHKIERMLDSGKKEVYAEKEMMRKKNRGRS